MSCTYRKVGIQYKMWSYLVRSTVSVACADGMWSSRNGDLWIVRCAGPPGSIPGGVLYFVGPDMVTIFSWEDPHGWIFPAREIFNVTNFKFEPDACNIASDWSAYRIYLSRKGCEEVLPFYTYIHAYLLTQKLRVGAEDGFRFVNCFSSNHNFFRSHNFERPFWLVRYKRHDMIDRVVF